MDDEDIPDEHDAQDSTPQNNSLQQHSEATPPEHNISTLKRPLQTDSDSDVKPLPQRNRKKYQPNVKAARRVTPHDESPPSKKEHSLC